MASCAMPALFGSSPLLCKDADGNECPWDPTQNRWIDGSIEGDIPAKRLAELFNVNHLIVSQVNPHVHILLRLKNGPNIIFNKIMFLISSEVSFRISLLANLGLFPSLLHKISSVINQEYEGHITIVPSLSASDFFRTLSRTTDVFVKHAISKGAKATWPKMSLIRNQCRVEHALDQIISELRAHPDAAVEASGELASLPTNLGLYQVN